jgi:aminoglycoside 6'-N-acetyltransferase I
MKCCHEAKVTEGLKINQSKTDKKITPLTFYLSDYKREHEDSLIKAFIETFVGEPWNETWEYSWVLNRIRWLENVPNFIGKVCLENERVVGALLGYAKPFRDKLDYEILELFVLPDYQGKGFGKLLIEDLSNSLPVEKYGVIHLLTGRDTSSEKFYEKIGYARNDKLCFMVHRR